MDYFKNKFIKLFFIVSIFLIGFFVLPGFASAATYYWVGTGSINSSSNWSSGDNDCGVGGGAGIPGNGDTAIFHTCHNNATIDVKWPATGALANLTMQTGYNKTITINSGKTLTISGVLTIISGALFYNNGTVTMTGTATGELTGAGIFSNMGTLNYAGSTITISSLAVSGFGVVNYNSTSTDQTVYPATYYQLDVSKGTYTATLGGDTGVSILHLLAGTLDLSIYNFSSNNSTINGTLNDSSARGTNSFNGNVSIYNNAVWESTGNSAYTIKGGIDVSNSGTFNGGTGTYTFSSNSQSLSGTLNFGGVISVSSGVVLTNTGTVNIAGTGVGQIAGSGTFTNANNSILNYAGSTITVNTFDPSGTGNIVDYDSTTTDQTIHSGTYDSLTINKGTYTATLGGNTTVAGNLNIVSGTLNLDTYDFTNSGTTTINGTLNDSSSTGVNIFTGDITINTVWTSTGNSDYIIKGNISGLGSFSPGNGTYIFSGTNSTIGISEPVTFGGTIFVPYGSTLNNEGTTLTVSTLEISGTFNNYGTVNAGTIDSGTLNSLPLPSALSGPGISSVAVSNNGKYLVAVNNLGTIWASLDSGVTWNNTGLGAAQFYSSSVAISTVNSNMIWGGTAIQLAAVYDFEGVGVEVLKADYNISHPVSWSLDSDQVNAPNSDSVGPVATSFDGTKLAYIDGDTGYVWIMDDNGGWHKITGNTDTYLDGGAQSIAISPDGLKVVATDSNGDVWETSMSDITGSSWQEETSSISPAGFFSAVVSGAGKTLLAFNSPSEVWVSTKNVNDGAWSPLMTSLPTSTVSNPVAISNDGTKKVYYRSDYIGILNTTSGKFINGAGATLNYSGDSIGVTLVASALGNTVEYNGGGYQTIFGTTYYNLTISTGPPTPGVALLGGNTIVNNDMTITQGGVDISLNSYALSVGGNWSNSGDFIPGSNSVTFLGPSSKTTGIHTISGTNTFYDLTIKAGSFVNLPVGVTTIANSFTAKGAAANQITIDSYEPESAATLSMGLGKKVSCDYLSLTDLTATGGATWNAGPHSVAVSNVNGWNFNPTYSGLNGVTVSGPNPITTGSLISFNSYSSSSVTESLHVCRTNLFANGSCNAEWCHTITPQLNNPSCSYTISSGDGTGLKYYYAYLVDKNGNLATGSPKQGTFFVSNGNSSLKLGGKLNIGGGLIIK